MDYKLTFKLHLLPIYILTILAGCDNSTKDSTPTTKTDTTTTIKTPGTIDTVKFIWVYDDVAEMPVRHTTVNPDTLTPEKLIDLINIYQGKDKIILDFIKVSRDTIYVAIKNSTYLTQNIGTTGADAYISTTVFTLTELKGIRYVNFNFVEGDHAQPGTYTRQQYIDRYNSTTSNK